MLTKAMLSGLTADQMALHPAGWYEAQNIVQILERQVVAVDARPSRWSWTAASSCPTPS